MKTYIKSLFPFRWGIVVLFILMMEYVLSIIKFPLSYHIINIITWFVVDITIGLGREERNVFKNLVGVMYLLILAGLLITEMR